MWHAVAGLPRGVTDDGRLMSDGYVLLMGKGDGDNEQLAVGGDEGGQSVRRSSRNASSKAH